MKGITRRKFCSQLLKVGGQVSLIYLSTPLKGNSLSSSSSLLLEGDKSCDNELNLNHMIQPVPDSAIMEMDDWYVWGASAVPDDSGVYHLLFSRWPKETGMGGWVTHSEIAHATSNSPIGPYKFQDVALPARGDKYWDGENTHNPTVKRFGNKYYLYYNGNREFGDKVEVSKKKYTKWWRHRNNQRVGVAVADHPAGPWKRFDEPLIDVGPWDWNGLITTNPSVAKHQDGTYLLAYKTVALSSEKDMPFGGKVTHGIAKSDHPTGPFKKHPEPVFTHPTAKFPAEDPYVFFLKDRYWGILKDQEGYFVESEKQQLVLFESYNGIEWELAKHPLVTKPKIAWQGGEVQTVSRLERPQLLIENDTPKVLFAAIHPGEGKTFNVHIPLQKELI